MSSAARITKEQIKLEVDKVGDEHLDALYRIILALEEPIKGPPRPELGGASGWSQFISEMYGSTAEAPLERWPEGRLMVQDALTQVQALGLSTPSESAAFVREDRDAR